MKVGYIGGTPEEDPYRRGFDFWVEFANNSTGAYFSEGVFADYGLYSDDEGAQYYAAEGPDCGGIDPFWAIASNSSSEAIALVDQWHRSGIHLVIIGVEWQQSLTYRQELSKHFINHFAVNVADWVLFRRGATDWTWGVGNSHFELGQSFVTLTARESQEGICLLLPEPGGNFEIVMYEALMKAVESARELGVEVLLTDVHGFRHVDDFNGTVGFVRDFAQQVVESGCDILMAFVRDSIGAALLQMELAAINAPLLAEFFLPEMPESEWAELGTIGEHVYTAAFWHPTVNFDCPVFGNTGTFVDLYEDWEERNYGVVRTPGLEEASAVVAGVLILLAQKDPRFFYAESVQLIEDVQEEQLFGYRLMKVLEGIRVTTFYGDVHFDGRGQNFVKTPVTLQYFEQAKTYAVRPKGPTIRPAALPMDSFESRESGEESLPGCPPGTRMIPPFADGWTVRGKYCEACEPLEFQDEYNQTECKACPDGEISGFAAPGCAECSPGSYRGPGMASCAACAEGHFANASGATACERCIPGTVVSDNSTRCTSCPPGFYSGAWDTECHRCNWGEFTDGPGATACDRCPAGRFASEEGQSSCEGCPAGYSAPSAGGARECLPCQKGFSTRGANESEMCEACEDGFYSNETGSPTCLPCPGTFGTKDIASDSSARCACAPGSYWHKESPNSEPICQTRHCGTALVCEGWSNDPPRVAEGYNAGAQPFQGAEPPFLVRCGGRRQCPAGLELGRCPAGHQDKRACAECEEGYSKVRNGNCVRCEAMPAYVPVLLCVALAGLALLFCNGLRTQEFYVESDSAIKVTGIAGILVTSLQILGVFRHIAVDWPEPVSTFHSALAILLEPIELFNVNCILAIRAPVQSYALIILMLPALLIFIFLLFRIAGSCLHREGQREMSNNTIFQIEGTLVLMFYTSISMLSLQAWQCEANPDFTASVVAYREVICWDSGEHAGMLALSCLAILIFVVGFFSLIAWATYLYPIQVTLPSGVTFLVRYRWIFNNFSPDRHYHGLQLCARNLLVTLLPVIFANNVPAQFLLVASTLLASLTLQCWLRPWRKELANRFDAACTTLLVLVLVVGSLLLSPDKRSVSLIVIVLFSLIFTLIGITFILAVAYHAYLRLAQQKRFAFFLCHHKEAAGVLARWVKIELKLRLGGQQIFLDSDELCRLDTLFGIVAYQTQNFVALLTKETLKRIWCAGEVTTAMMRGVPMICVACNDYEEPTDKFIEQLDKMWSFAQVAELARRGVSLPQVRDAFRHFRELPKIKLDRTAPYHEQAELIDAVLAQVATERLRGSTWSSVDSTVSKESCESSRGAAVMVSLSAACPDCYPVSVPATPKPPPMAEEILLKKGPYPEPDEYVVEKALRSSTRSMAAAQAAASSLFEMAQTPNHSTWFGTFRMRAVSGFVTAKDTNLMVGNFADPEAAMLCRVMQLQLQQALQRGIGLCSRDIPEALEQLRSHQPNHLFAVLTQGILARPEFAVLLVKACASSPRPGLVPIVADYVFTFPDANFYADLENGRVLAPKALEPHGVLLTEVGEAYKAIFNVISKRFSPHGSEKIQLTEVQEMAGVAAADASTSTTCTTYSGAGEASTPLQSPSWKRLARGW